MRSCVYSEEERESFTLETFNSLVFYRTHIVAVGRGLFRLLCRR